ncbi:hypothetical protein HYFRA_00011097 [Hymenoscyphus fraxineus]|uniref:AA9 family lytic polysaccharide monooxygenase n=1 Tax=Hymenoscyphus fraxineus TaxID=746836 RepID=A0A9N9L1E4_9HELO|nr:hypothetical protein HYFRA_00011097 [Hymenoscyphus fraxineus]
MAHQPSLGINRPNLRSNIPINDMQHARNTSHDQHPHRSSWLHNVGPMIAWLAHCNGPCASPSFNASAAEWFKIGQRGLLSGGIVEGWWYQREFQDWTGGPNIWTETLPKALKAGEYLIRHEILALHIEDKPQWYMECAHLNVSGPGTGFPGERFRVGIPGVWRLDGMSLSFFLCFNGWVGFSMG